MKSKHWVAVAASALGFGVASHASAHVCLDVPTSRAADMCKTHEVLEAALNTEQKVGPCGSSKGRSATPTVYKPGETITVKWTETIDHQPSWYRISLNPNGETFEDPTSYTDNTGKHPNTLADGIQDAPATMQEARVTLPNITCEKCVLQLIQVMGDKGSNGFGGNDGTGGKADNDDLYYACADIVLRGEPATGDAGLAADAGSSSATDSGAGSDATLGGADAGVGSVGDGGAAIPGSIVDSGSGGVSNDSGTMVATSGTPGASGGTVSSDSGSAAGAAPDSTSPADGNEGCSATTTRNSSSAGFCGVVLSVVALLCGRRRRA